MRNDFAISTERVKDGFVYVFVDTKKAVLRGMRWESLGDWGKRKFENLLFLTRMEENKYEKIKIKYVF